MKDLCGAKHPTLKAYCTKPEDHAEETHSEGCIVWLNTRGGNVLTVSEAPNNRNEDAEKAYQWLIKAAEHNHDARNLVSVIKGQMREGCDCFDLRGVAKVLALYHTQNR